MYKNISEEIKKINLDADLYKHHKTRSGKTDFGMDNTRELLEGGFGLYSTINVKKKIGPIKTEYFRISLTKKGRADFNIGLEKYRTSCNYILFGIPGQIFSLNDITEDFLAYYMLFTQSFILDNFNKINQQHYPFLTYSGLQCFELSNKVATEVEDIIFKMEHEIKNSEDGCSEMVRLYIMQIIILASRDYGRLMLKNMSSSSSFQKLFYDYTRLVSQHFLEYRKVSDYAEMLHVSADHLNRTIKNCSDRTAHEFIDEMLLMDAKAYLLQTGMTVSEIAYALKFTDPPHFNRFFKKLTGCTPVEFRKS